MGYVNGFIAGFISGYRFGFVGCSVKPVLVVGVCMTVLCKILVVRTVIFVNRRLTMRTRKSETDLIWETRNVAKKCVAIMAPKKIWLKFKGSGKKQG